MSGYEVVWREFGERVASRFDERLEPRTAEVKTAQRCVQTIAAGEFAHAAERVDDPGMAASGEHHQPLPSEVGNERLVVEHELVGPPHAVVEGLVAGWEALFEAGGSIYLSRDKERFVEDE